MRRYRLARRAFLAGVGGAVGLKIMLRNIEAAAEGASSPARFLLAHWPVGTLRHSFLPPSGSGTDYVASPILMPFETAGLRSDMTVFYGLSDGHLRCPGGGGHEAGTPFTTTCCSAEGTRQNGGESDDGVAGGPSFDQVFLKNVPGLARPGMGFANAICDARVDSNETSTQCLSYSYETASIPAANVMGNITEYRPLMPKLKPAELYASLFGSFMPSGATPDNQRAAVTALKLRKSVLDHALGELAELRRITPGSESVKIDAHADAIRKLEQSLSETLQGATGCRVPAMPPADLSGKTGNSRYSDNVEEDDSPTLRATAEAHLAIFTAAFQCDLLRVGTFQFMPGENHVSFGGMWPGEPARNAMHHPVSHQGRFITGVASGDPADLTAEDQARYQFLVNVQTWLNQRLADWLKVLKSTPDVFGQNLLDTTVVPYVTETAQPNHSRSPKPAFLFGGKKLGLKHGTFREFATVRPQVDLYLTCAQALLQTADPLSALAAERFVQFNPGAAPIDGLWSPT